MSKLTTLNYMLNHKLAPAGEMANHIETNGIFALDQFGNFKQFGPETHEAKAALAGIAVFLQHETSPPSPEFETWYLEQDPSEIALIAQALGLQEPEVRAWAIAFRSTHQTTNEPALVQALIELGTHT